MTMKKIKIHIFIFSALAFLNACNTFTEPTKEEIALQDNEAQIQQYVTDNGLTPTKTTSGLYYVITNSKPDNSLPTQGDLVTVRYQGKLLNGQVYDDYSTEDFQFIGGVTDPRAITSLNELVGAMRIGEKATAIVPFFLAHGSILYRGNTGLTLPPYTPIVLEVDLISSKTEQEQIDEYIANSGETYQRTESGIYYRILREGEGEDTPVDNSTVQVKYTGRFLDGEIFDQALIQPFTFTVGRGNVIDAWDEIIPLMKQGELRRVIIPHELAYGTQGNKGIPPYTPLTFDIELL